MNEGNTPALAFAASKFNIRILELEVSIFYQLNDMSCNIGSMQGLVKGKKFCFRNLYFYFRHGESKVRM